MKTKILSLTLILATCIGFSSCSEDVVEIPEEVTFKLDYSFVESGSMSRASGTDVYSSFYEKYIKTKQLTPKSYSLTFSNNGYVVAKINGLWENEDAIRLPEGEYVVTGYSYPNEPLSGQYYIPSDTVFLSFNETVTLTKNMKNLTLKANYDSYLLLFDVANTSKISLRGNSGDVITGSLTKDLPKDNTCYWTFVKDKNYTNGYYYSLLISRINEFQEIIYLRDIPFEKGKYYYFNDMTNSFDIPPMESGN